MEFLLLSIGLLFIISIILLILCKKKFKQLEENYKEEFYKNKEEEFKQVVSEMEKKCNDEVRFLYMKLEEKRQEIEAEKEKEERRLIERKQSIEEIINEISRRRDAIEADYQNSLAHGKEKVEIEVKAHQDLLMQQAAVLIEEEQKRRQNQMESALATFFTQCTEKQIQAQNELDKVRDELSDFKKKQQAANEEILRRRQLEEQQDFYRIVLDENARTDMQILLSIREKLISHENLDKLIYDAYVAKPVLEMTKRVLGGKAPSGIYKITRLKTGEIYIGKSTDIKKRWGEHAKTAYGVGSIAHSILHTTIKHDGIENFTFELLEEVPKDKLTEREKYWITFYDSKNYGMNMREG